MSAPQPGGSRASVLARAAIGLYPPAWRARYGDEVRALLDDSGAGPLAAVGLAWHAVPAWVRPPRNLYDQPARMRASLATVLMAWTALAGLAAVFIQLAQAQPSAQSRTLAQHPVIQWSYWVFDGAVGVSVLAVIVGGLPLWLRMLHAARPERRRREVALLLAPVAVPALYVAVYAVVAGLVRRSGPPTGSVLPWRARPVVDLANGGVGPWWFLALVVLAFVAGAVAAAGPGLALRSLRPDGPAVTRAARAAGLAVVTMCLAGAASIVAVIGLYLWAPAAAGYHESWQLALYLPAVLLAAAVAAVSAARGLRATRSPARA